MSPTTTEEAIETELLLAKENLHHAKLKLQELRSEILVAEEKSIEYRMAVDLLTEELRKFRLTYPSLCKLTKA